MRKILFIQVLLLAIVLSFSIDSGWCGDNSSDSQLANSDCVKCHPKIVHENQEAGGKHKTAVGCLDCHEGGHPPLVPGEQIIPECSKCHQGEAHFELKGCLRCHQNPHQPLNIVFSGENNMAACNTCHPEQVEEIKSNPSAHSEVDCTFCHTKHGYIPDCLKCHEPHREGQQFKDCVSCHKVHQPLNVAYGDNIPNADCGACHGDLKEELESGSTKHSKLKCVYCHKAKHGVRPACQDCHGVPHPAPMMERFKKCTDCHNDAHDLVK